jgi:hypothetical protein
LLKASCPSSDVHKVKDARHAVDSDASLADVIPLPTGKLRDRDESATAPPEPDPKLDVEHARASVERSVELLARRHGDRWRALPADLGRAAAAAERLLVLGPTSFDPTIVSPADVASTAWMVVQSAMTLTDQVVDEAKVLGEALGTRIVGLPLRELDRIAGAVLDLGVVARMDPAWANPAAADAARAVLESHGEELRATTALHHQLYTSFTEHVLDIPEPWFRSARRPWRLLARSRVRRALTAASRTGRLPGSLRSVSASVLEVHRARRRLASLAPLLSTHLGRGAWGPLTDVDGLVASVVAVRRFQRTMGDRLDEERMTGLLTAYAFRSPELVGPAATLRTALRTWQAEVASLCGGDPWVLPADALARWVVHTAAALPVLTRAARTMNDVGARPATLRSLVDDLLLREKVAELEAQLAAKDGEGHSAPRSKQGSAS